MVKRHKLRRTINGSNSQSSEFQRVSTGRAPPVAYSSQLWRWLQSTGSSQCTWFCSLQHRVHHCRSFQIAACQVNWCARVVARLSNSRREGHVPVLGEVFNNGRSRSHYGQAPKNGRRCGGGWHVCASFGWTTRSSCGPTPLGWSRPSVRAAPPPIGTERWGPCSTTHILGVAGGRRFGGGIRRGGRHGGADCSLPAAAQSRRRTWECCRTQPRTVPALVLPPPAIQRVFPPPAIQRVRCATCRAGVGLWESAGVGLRGSASVSLRGGSGVRLRRRIPGGAALRRGSCGTRPRLPPSPAIRARCCMALLG